MSNLKKILLITLGLGTVLFADFSKSAHIVTDNSTGLQWQDDNITATMTWTVAISYCEALTLDGQSDWRLPNLNELTSLLDDSTTAPSIDTSVFDYTTSNYYWSSTTYVGGASNAWVVDFLGGIQYIQGKSSYSVVRCVRAVQ